MIVRGLFFILIFVRSIYFFICLRSICCVFIVCEVLGWVLCGI